MIGLGLLWCIAIIFGAPIYHSHIKTLGIASIINNYTLLPLLLDGHFDDKKDLIIKYFDQTLTHVVSIFTFIGIIPIGLDWDKPWQVYPLTIGVGASIGYSIGNIINKKCS